MQQPKPFSTQVRSGVSWSLAFLMARHGIQLISTLVLSRLVTPAHFGLVAMAGTLYAFLYFFSDMGLSWATIQAKDLSEDDVHGMFWMNTAVGAGLWIISLAAAPITAWFYRDARLLGAVVFQGANFLIVGLATQPQAGLRRDMKFKALTLIEIGSLAVGTSIGILLASRGLGYWAVLSVPVLSGFVRVVLSFRATHYWPRVPKNWRRLMAHLRFGGLVSIAGLFFYFSRHMDDVLIGRIWGPVTLSYYAKAYFLMTLPTLFPAVQLSGVIVPALSALFRARDPDLAEKYRRAVLNFSFIAAPVCAGLALTAQESIRIVYGSQWAPVVPILRWLAIAGIFQPAYNCVSWILIAVGKVRQYLQFSVITACILVLAFALSVRHGPVAVAIAYVVAGGLLLSIPSLGFAHRASNIAFSPTLRGLLRVYLCVALMSVALIFADRFWIHSIPLTALRLLAKSMLGAIVYFGTSQVFASDELRGFVSALGINSFFRLAKSSGAAIEPQSNL